MNIKEEEKRLGEEVAKKATRYIQSQIKKDLPKSRIKNLDKRKKRKEPSFQDIRIESTMGDHRLLGFRLVAPKLAFVFHFGVVADNTEYLRTHPKSGKPFKYKKTQLKSYGFFDDVYEKSGALKILEDGLFETRILSVTKKMKILIGNSNK